MTTPSSFLKATLLSAESLTSPSKNFLSSAASALDYSMKTLESQSFLFNIKTQSESLQNKDTLAMLSNYTLSENDSDNIKQFVTAAKLMNQQQVQTPTNTLTNLVRR